jgi:hypothetical protein
MTKIANLEYVELRPSAIKESWDAESIWSPVIPSFVIRVIAEDGTVGVGPPAKYGISARPPRRSPACWTSIGCASPASTRPTWRWRTISYR